MNMGLLGGQKRIKGRILHVREILGTVRVEVEFAKSRAASLFTGAVDYGKLVGKIAGLTVDKVDTRKGEIRALKEERRVKLRALREQRRKPA